MVMSRRVVTVPATLSLVVVLLLWAQWMRLEGQSSPWGRPITEHIPTAGSDDEVADHGAPVVATSNGIVFRVGASPTRDKDDDAGQPTSSPQTDPAAPPRLPAPRREYNWTLVLARMQSEDVSWVADHLPDVQTAIYVADDIRAPFHPPVNKGHEAITYLTYIIDHYDKLPDIAIFMHSHRFSWHNNQILHKDAVEMVRRLSSARVVREGYMSLRCHWVPGCPDWTHPSLEAASDRPEEVAIAAAWDEFFPGEALPPLLAQTCCSQFAVTRERIRAIPRHRYNFFRSWLIKNPYPDFTSGRVWEYLWQYLFLSQSYLCPHEHVCYCDGFGICFEDHDGYDRWNGLKWHERDLRNQLANWAEELEQIRAENRSLSAQELGREDSLRRDIEWDNREANRLRVDAIRRGKDPQHRAAIAGRPWAPGDGF